MENLLFLPVSSWNFNLMLSTESISPLCFYPKRSFGGNYFSPIDTNQNEGCLLLYTYPPKSIKLEEDEFPIYIGILPDYLPNLSKVDDEGGRAVYCSYETIYFNFSYPVFFFNSVSEKELAISESFAALETKCLDRYQDRFFTLDEWGLVAQKHYHRFPWPLRLSHDFEIDEKINYFKGLVYSHYISLTTQKSNSEIALNNAIRNVENSWSALLSALSFNSEDRKYFKNRNPKDDLNIPALDLLNRTIDQLLLQIYSFSTPVQLQDKLAALFKAKSISQDEEAILNSILNRIPELRISLNRIAEKHLPTIDWALRSFKAEINQTIKIYPNHNKNNEKIYNRFSIRIEKILKQIKLVHSQTNQQVAPSQIEKFSKYILSDPGIAVLTHPTLDDKNYRLLAHILNVLFLKNKGTVPEVDVEHFKSIVSDVGNTVKEIFGEDSVERNWIAGFYQFYVGKSLVFDAGKIPSPVLSNFFAFILNHKSIETLVGFCEKQMIDRYNFALEYWGVFNGFAAIPKIYTRGILNIPDVVTQIDYSLRIGLANCLPSLKEIPFADILESEVHSLRSKPRERAFDDLWKPIENNVELRPYLKWIETCIEYCMTAAILEYDTHTPAESLKRELEVELFTRRRPKGFRISELNDVIALIDFDLLNELRNKRQNLVPKN